MRVFVCAMIFASIFILSACPPLLNVRLRNETNVTLSIYVLDSRKQEIDAGETSRKLLSPGGNWSMRAAKCEYTYNFPDIYGLTRTTQGRTSVFTLVVEKDFIVRLEYPPDWKGEKPVIAGLPAVPQVMCK